MQIGVVLVTYNREKELQKALEAYENQSLLPSYIIVVNNNSTDGTNKILNIWQSKENSIKKIVINLEENVGGSGGFYYGLEKSLELDSDWIWVSDDDAYPDKDAFSNLNRYLTSKTESERNNIAALCGQIINNGTIDILHRRRIKQGLFKIKQVAVSTEEYKNNEFDINLFSYVGSLLSKKHLKEAGLPEKDYFIYYDDTEHSYRISKLGRIVCIPKVKITHDINMSFDGKVNWKGYYALRNRMLFLKKHFNNRYYHYEYAREYSKYILRKVLKVKPIKNKQINVALQDSKKNIKGIHSVYKPGWKY